MKNASDWTVFLFKKCKYPQKYVASLTYTCYYKKLEWFFATG